MCNSCTNNCVDTICCAIGNLRNIAGNTMNDGKFYIPAVSKYVCGIKIHISEQNGTTKIPIHFNTSNAPVGFCPMFCRCDVPKKISAGDIIADSLGCNFVTTVNVKINCNNNIPTWNLYC